MAVAIVMDWPGVTPELYEEARARVGWERDVPAGAIFHAVRFTDDGMLVGDVWESQADFDRFGAERLMPVVQELGIETEPHVRIEQLYTTFNAQATAVTA
jgi:hypothetical protein